MRRIDLNVDVGEGFGFDRDLFEFATSANICCGVHAGSAELTRETVAYCRERGIRFGAHPGYPDRANMGRQSITDETTRAWLDSIFRQVMDFVHLARPAYLKPHGAFYNDTAQPLPEGWDRAVTVEGRRGPYDAGGIFLAHYPGIGSLQMLLKVHRLPLMGLEPTAHAEVARRSGQVLLREGFADRAYRADGTLVPRTEPGAVLEDPAAVAAQVRALAERVDSICLHGDTPGCVAFAELAYRTLVDAGYEVGT